MSGGRDRYQVIIRLEKRCGGTGMLLGNRFGLPTRCGGDRRHFFDRTGKCPFIKKALKNLPRLCAWRRWPADLATSGDRRQVRGGGGGGGGGGLPAKTQVRTTEQVVGVGQFTSWHAVENAGIKSSGGHPMRCRQSAPDLTTPFNDEVDPA